MHRSYIDKHLLVDRYLRNALDDTETAAFEERLCWDEELLHEVELAERLREAMQDVVANQKFQVDESAAGFSKAISSWFAVPQFAAAASFLVAVALTTSVFVNPFGDSGGLSSNPARQTVSFQLFSVRGAAEQELTVNDNTWTVFEVDAVESCARYRVTLSSIDEPGKSRLTELSLTPNFERIMAVGMPGEELHVGRYVLALEGVEDSAGMQCDHTEEITFEISAKN